MGYESQLVKIMAMVTAVDKDNVTVRLGGQEISFRRCKDGTYAFTRPVELRLIEDN
jgi:hypothetical protein